MNWLVTYAVGAAFMFGVMVTARTGDEWTDTPLIGCVLFALLWPIVMVAVLVLWVKERIS